MRNKPSELMVFAAGFGTRMQPLTNNLPKPLISVGGRTLLDHSLDVANAASIEKTVVNTHYLGDQIKNHLFGQPYIVEHEPEILETGGGLQNARHHFSGPSVLTCNSDSVWLVKTRCERFKRLGEMTGTRFFCVRIPLTLMGETLQGILIFQIMASSVDPVIGSILVHKLLDCLCWTIFIKPASPSTLFGTN
jgi:GTP:adenosylcobinamide-phosphate guanylyltransferase